jgi:hypothetical protein
MRLASGSFDQVITVVASMRRERNNAATLISAA